MSPLLQAQEVNLVNKIIDNCETLEDTLVASKAVDYLQKSQPNEKAIIQEMRDVICDMSFEFFDREYITKK
jgi:hypothetical protein